MRTSDIDAYEDVVEDYEDHLHKLQKVVGALKRRSRVLDSSDLPGVGSDNYDAARADDVDYYDGYVNGEASTLLEND